MTDIARAWGAPPTARYEDLAARFRPVFAAIREGAVARDIGRALPFEGYEALRQAGFPLLRVPAAQGGIGVTLPELFGLVIELGEAEPNLAGGDEAALFAAAMASGARRVVVKRARLAPPLDPARSVDVDFQGKSVRFDVYLP